MLAVAVLACAGALALSACHPTPAPGSQGIVAGNPQYSEFIDLCHPLQGVNVPNGGYAQKDPCWSSTWLNVFDIPGVTIPYDAQTKTYDLTPALGCVQGSTAGQPCGDVGPAVKALWNAFGAGNGPGNPGTSVIYIPAGKYKLTRTAMVLDEYGTGIIGEDPAKTTIQWAPESSAWIDMFELIDVGSFKLDRLHLDGANQAVALVRMLQSCCYGGAATETRLDCNLPVGTNAVCGLPVGPAQGGLYAGGAYNIVTTDDIFENASYGVGVDGYGWGIQPYPTIPILNSNMGLNQIRRSTFQNISTSAIKNQNQNSLDWLVADNQFLGNPGYGAVVNYAGSVHVVDNYFKGNNRDMVLYEGPDVVRGNRSEGSNAFLLSYDSFTDVSGNYVVTSGKSFKGDTDECSLLGGVNGGNACSYAVCAGEGAALFDNYFEVPSAPGACTYGGQDYGGVAVFSLSAGGSTVHLPFPEGGNYYAAKLLFEDDASCSNASVQPDSYICSLKPSWGLPRRIQPDSPTAAQNDIRVSAGTGCGSNVPGHACAAYNDAQPTGPLMQVPPKSNRFVESATDWTECTSTTPGATGCAAKINAVVDLGSSQPFAIYFPDRPGQFYDLEGTIIVPPGVDAAFVGDGLNSSVRWKGTPWTDAAPTYMFHFATSKNTGECPLEPADTTAAICPAVGELQDLALFSNPNAGANAGTGGVLVDSMDQPGDLVYADAVMNNSGGYIPGVDNQDWHDMVMGPLDNTALRLDQSSTGVKVVGGGAAATNSALTTGVTTFSGGQGGELDVTNFGKAVLIGDDAEGTYGFGSSLTNGYLSETQWRMFAYISSDPSLCGGGGYVVNPITLSSAYAGGLTMLGGNGTTPLFAGNAANAKVLALVQGYSMPGAPSLACLSPALSKSKCTCAAYKAATCTTADLTAMEQCEAYCPQNTFNVQGGQQAQVDCLDQYGGIFVPGTDVEPAGWTDTNLATLAHTSLADLRSTYEAPGPRKGLLTNVRLHDVVRQFGETNASDPNAQFGPVLTIQKSQ
jgi:hypothetical protein